MIPDTIYLQIHGADLEGATWCVDRVNGNDIEYARVHTKVSCVACDDVGFCLECLEQEYDED